MLDKFTFSVDNTGNLNNVGNGRPWEGPGSVIESIQVVAPDAATNFRWNLADGADVPFNDQQRQGNTVSFEANAYQDVNLRAERKWNLTAKHTGAAAQTIDVLVNWE